MTTDDSLTTWIDRLHAGDEEAARRVWNHFSQQLLGLAKARLAAGRRGVASEEDVVVSVFDTLFRRAKDGQFAWVADRDDLWRLLVTIVERKALNVLRDEQRLKRGGPTKGDTAHIGAGDSTANFVDPADLAPTPELAALLAESFEQLLALLDDDELRQIALLRLEGYTNAEIADRIGKVVATVERRFGLIRKRWENWE
jgi:RNA polymerase sigma factor (sigma-70 family)